MTQANLYKYRLEIAISLVTAQIVAFFGIDPVLEWYRWWMIQ